jgi:uncharacterized membrane protein
MSLMMVNPDADFISPGAEIFRTSTLRTRSTGNMSDALGVRPESVGRTEEIPFLPVSFFKTHIVRTGDFIPEIVFESSGTTGSVTSRHLVKDLGLYRQSFHRRFRAFLWIRSRLVFIGLLPAYLERSHSSLVY